MASQWNQHCANCIGALSFLIHRHTVVGRAVPECRPGARLLFGPDVNESWLIFGPDAVDSRPFPPG